MPLFVTRTRDPKTGKFPTIGKTTIDDKFYYQKDSFKAKRTLTSYVGSKLTNKEQENNKRSLERC